MLEDKWKEGNEGLKKVFGSGEVDGEGGRYDSMGLRLGSTRRMSSDETITFRYSMRTDKSKVPK